MNGQKVTSITKENYQQVVDRAKLVRDKFKEHHTEHGGFPSLRWASENWNCPMSLKAMFRHRQAVAAELGVEIGGPTHVLPRPKRKTAPSAEQEAASIEAVEAPAEEITAPLGN